MRYVGMVVGWCYRFPISYKIVGGDPDLIENRDVTLVERDAIKKAYRIRLTISNILLYSSVLLSVGSYIILRNHLFEPSTVVKVIMVISGLIAIILILVNGIHFIPGSPIR